jgi:hypothetical protein
MISGTDPDQRFEFIAKLLGEGGSLEAWGEAITEAITRAGQSGKKAVTTIKLTFEPRHSAAGGIKVTDTVDNKLPDLEREACFIWQPNPHQLTDDQPEDGQTLLFPAQKPSPKRKRGAK